MCIPMFLVKYNLALRGRKEKQREREQDYTLWRWPVGGEPKTDDIGGVCGNQEPEALEATARVSLHQCWGLVQACTLHFFVLTMIFRQPDFQQLSPTCTHGMQQERCDGCGTEKDAQCLPSTNRKYLTALKWTALYYCTITHTINPGLLLDNWINWQFTEIPSIFCRTMQQWRQRVTIFRISEMKISS